MSACLFLTQDKNRLAGALISADSVRPSRAISRTAVSRVGNGVLGLAGAYTGSADATYELQIAAGSTPHAAAPGYNGVGSGLLTAEAASNAVVQTLKIECIQPALVAATAWGTIEGVRVEAQSPGSAGNALALTLDTSGLFFSATTFTLLNALKAGTSTMSGQMDLDWDTVTGTPERVPADALRICLNGDHTTIYRNWKSWQTNQWNYYFEPALVKDYPEGSKIEVVTGTYTATLTNGSTTETYSNLITGYDLLAAIRDHSTLLRVTGVISADPTLDNFLAAIDIRTRTAALILSNTGSGSFYATGFNPAQIVSGASTEIITALCVSADPTAGNGVGEEKWIITGTQSGPLGLFTTGDTVTIAGKFNLTLPAKYPPGWGQFLGKFNTEIHLAGTGRNISICVDHLRAGPKIKNGTFILTYRKRPSGLCNCENQSYTFLPSADTCLGLTTTTGDTMDSAIQTRLISLTQWLKTFVSENVAPDLTAASTGQATDILVANTLATLLGTTVQKFVGQTNALNEWDLAFTDLQSRLNQLVKPAAPTFNAWNPKSNLTSSGFASAFIRPSLPNGNYYQSSSLALLGGTYLTGNTEPVWANSLPIQDGTLSWTSKTTYWSKGTAYSAGQLVYPKNGFYYKVNVAGTSSSVSEPIWPGAGGGVVDGTVTWNTAGTDEAIPLWSAGQSPKMDAVTGTLYFSRPNTANGSYYQTAVLPPGTPYLTGSSEPTWANFPVLDGNLPWAVKTTYWSKSTAYSVGDTAYPKNGHYYTVTVAGTSSATTEPTWPASGTIVDGTVTWSTTGTDTTYNKWVKNTAPSSLTGVLGNFCYVLPSVDDGYYYLANTFNNVGATQALTTSTEPNWAAAFPRTIGVYSPLSGAALDGDYAYYAAIPYWFPNMTYKSPGITIDHKNGRLYALTTTGTTGSTCPNWNSAAPGQTITDGTAVWTCQTLGKTLQDTNWPSTLQQIYTDWMGICLVKAGLSPFDLASTATSVAHILSASPCWQDTGAGYWWEWSDGALPVFTNKDYVRCAKQLDGSIQSTQEFGLVVKVADACISNLLEGDSITLTINGSSASAAYQVNDQLIASLIAENPIAFRDGADGNAVSTWAITGSSSGRASNWLLNEASPNPAVVAGVTLALTPGGIPWALGDWYSVGIEAAALIWRKNGGNWSDSLPILTGTTIDSGLTLTAVGGISPSWVVGDSATFLAAQPYAPSLAADLSEEAWQWMGAGATLTGNIAGAVAVVAICRYSLPAGAEVTLTVGSQNFTWASPTGAPLVAVLSEPITDPEISLTFTSATGGQIGWFWAGTPISLDMADSQTRTLHWAMLRGAGNNPRAFKQGKGFGMSFVWNGFLTQNNVDALISAFEAHKSSQDAPICVIPNNVNPEAFLTLLPDELAFTDVYQFQSDLSSSRNYSLKMELKQWLGR